MFGAYWFALLTLLVSVFYLCFLSIRFAAGWVYAGFYGRITFWSRYVGLDTGSCFAAAVAARKNDVSVTDLAAATLVGVLGLFHNLRIICTSMAATPSHARADSGQHRPAARLLDCRRRYCSTVNLKASENSELNAYNSTRRQQHGTGPGHHGAGRPEISMPEAEWSEISARW